MSDQGLTDAQRRVTRIVLAVAGPDGFHLAGGAALVASNLTSRPTRDIDAFTPENVDVGAVADRLRLRYGRTGSRSLNPGGWMGSPR